MYLKLCTQTLFIIVPSTRNDFLSPVAVCIETECLLEGLSSVHLSGTLFPGINPCLRKIALKLKLKKVIEQQGDCYVIKTCSTFRNYTVAFRVGQEFQEFTEGLDNRHVKVQTGVRGGGCRKMCPKCCRAANLVSLSPNSQRRPGTATNWCVSRLGRKSAEAGLTGRKKTSCTW